jgi:two-component system, response regulator
MIAINGGVDILLVEDSADDAALAMAAIKARNLDQKVVHVVDVDQALELVYAIKLAANWHPRAAPKVIILDLKLARRGGLDLLQQLKTEERTRHIPVVVLTSSTEEREMLESYRLGVNSYVVKPLNSRQYAQVVGDIAYYWLSVNQHFG